MATGGTDNSKHTGTHQLFIDRVPGRQLIDFTLIFILCVHSFAPYLRLVTTASIFGSAGHATCMFRPQESLIFRLICVQSAHMAYEIIYLLISYTSRLDIETPRATLQFFERPVMSNNLCAEVLSLWFSSLREYASWRPVCDVHMCFNRESSQVQTFMLTMPLLPGTGVPELEVYRPTVKLELPLRYARYSYICESPHYYLLISVASMARVALPSRRTTVAT
ncbi:hypothetical protein B0H13DRAFT_2670135 [Mycena leptocephala]|nr:hypothetical protein B0H13DRAFT_2670135 [Mycena leptocephala]